MSGDLENSGGARPAAPGPRAWATPGPVPGSEPTSTIPWERYRAALKRRLPLIAAVLALGAIGGFAATRLVRPTYQGRSTIWLASTGSLDRKSAPMGAHEFLGAQAWEEVLRSYAVLDDVVQEHSLFVTPAKRGD